MTPDVSGVLTAVEELSEPIVDFAFRMDAFKRDTALTPPSPAAIVEVMDQVQQAAEQACYRYALRLFEALDDSTDGVPLAVRSQRARLRQLLAGSA